MKLPPAKSILRNFWLKFFSVCLATVIWLAIHFGIRNEIPPLNAISIDQLNINKLLAQKDIRVPVTVVQTPGDTRAFKITPAEVLVTMVGDQKVLQKATPHSIRLYVDLRKFEAFASPTEDVHADVPPNINVLEISPATVAVEQVKH